ncbi:MULTISPECIES: type VII secretion protein EssA [Bacillaceae]|uniref:type VII secretion protein EssA n=1 Tax=Bacillaceae TaxID=186817 RepID=UPI002FFE32DB
MKELVKTFSTLIVFLGFCLFLSTSAWAESTTDDNGKMQLKTDRIGQDAANREKLDQQFNKETELEKMAPDLFEEQTRAVIQTKQSELNQQTKDMEQKLLVEPSSVNTTLNDTKNALFARNYTVQYTNMSNEEQNDGENKGLPVLIGFVLASCGGIYVMMRRMLE